jgi:hypothetical protein
MKNKTYLAVLEVTISGKKSYQVFLVNRKSKRAIQNLVRKRYEIKSDTKFKILKIISSDTDTNREMSLIVSFFNIFWGPELFNKKGEDSYRIRYLDHLLTLVYFLGLKHMHEVMKKIKTTSP